MSKGPFNITLDSCFEEVIKQCAGPREDQSGTWIDRDIQHAYTELHELGVAHSVECWNGGKLVGGLYGIALGGVFFGESMFSRESNASKVAFAMLCKQLLKWGFTLIDCQVHNPHLESLGAIEIPREVFLTELNEALVKPSRKEWQFDENE